MTDQPKYDTYTLQELYDARDHLDSDAFPDRAAAINREIARRLAGTSPEPPHTSEPSTPNAVLRKRRFWAFFIDSAIIAIVSTVVDNLITYPLPRLVDSAFPFLVFCSYFLIFEGISRGAASPGKRLLTLHVLSSDGAPLRLTSVCGRVLLVGLLVTGDWDTILHLTRPLPYAQLITSLISGACFGLLLYNWRLTYSREDGSMLHDILSGSRVLHQRIAPTLTAPQSLEPDKTWLSRFPEPWAALMLIIIGFLFFFGLTIGVARFQGHQDLLTYLRSSSQDDRVVAERVHNRIYTDMSVRSRVTLTTTYLWKSGKDAQRILNIKVWIPFISWNEETLQNIARPATKDVRVTEGYYNAARLTVWTGSRYVSYKKPIPLKINE